MLKRVTPLEAIAPTIGSIILGAAFGWGSETLAGKLVGTGIKPAPARA